MPAVSGQFYPGTASGLSRALLALTREVKTPEPRSGRRPPRGYVYSGAVAGDVFSSVQVPGRAVIFCPNHTGLGRTSPSCPTGRGGCRGGRTDRRGSRRPPRNRLRPPAGGRIGPPAGACDRSPASVPPPVPARCPHRPRRPRTPLPRGVPGARGDRRGRDRGGRRTPLLVASSDMSHYVPDAVARKKTRWRSTGCSRSTPRGSTGPSGASGSRCAGCCRPRSSSSPPAVLARPRRV